jgi:hypothetical protein
MAETKAHIGYQTLVKMADNASPPVFTTIAEVKEVSGFGFTASQQEATHMESPDGYKEWVGGMKDGDTMTVRMNFTSDNAATVKAAADAGLRKQFQIVPPVLTPPLPVYAFSGVPVSWHEQGMTPDGILEVLLGIKLSGAITTV